MDPLGRLTLLLWQIFRGRVSRTHLVVALVVIGVALAIGLVEWLGYWPDALRVERGGRMPRVAPL